MDYQGVDTGGGGRIRAATAEFRRATWGLFSAGFATFALLYSVQPLLPEFSREFGVTPAVASLALSLSTAVLAVFMLIASSFSDVVGRKGIMVVALAASALATLAVAFASTWPHVLILRTLMGATLSGLPAVAMAYLVDEVESAAVGRAMGLYIGGSAFGGMSGRLIMSVLVDVTTWRIAMAVLGAVGLACAILLWRGLPASRHFQPRRLHLTALAASLAGHLRDPGLRLLFLLAFLLMGSFVTVYNYIAYRLLAPPYGLSQTAIGLIFASYLLGSLSSAWMGGLADRFGRRRVLWAGIVIMLAGILMTLGSGLVLIVGGIAVMTFGFFGAHSIASSWVGLRANGAKAQASSLYLLAYYMGSSLAGTAGGLLWAWSGWHGVVAGVTVLSTAGLAVSVLLARIAPPAWMKPGPG
ncbi:MFS transporter [Chthonobacter albigriseus]|uniref:MFS transporter n=1 Tax=Chthonobacter albigriseus TaxID=1683161 RepID=UPI003CC7D46A